MSYVAQKVTTRFRNHETTLLRRDTRVPECLHSILPATARASAFGRSTLASPLPIRRRSGILGIALLLILLVATTRSFLPAAHHHHHHQQQQQQRAAGVRGNGDTGAKTTSPARDDQRSRGKRSDDNGDGIPMKLSLWLIPPGDDDRDADPDPDAAKDPSETGGVFDRARRVIDGLSTERNGPRFLPHVTIAGGIEVRSSTEAAELAETLRAGLSGFGPVECTFGDLLLSAPECWNQALVAELAPPFSEGFRRLCNLSRELSGVEERQRHPTNNGDDPTFPPPLGIPHMSLYYGDSPPEPNGGEYLSEIFGGREEKSFRAHRVMLWKTDLSSADGVPEWEPLADISLL